MPPLFTLPHLAQSLLMIPIWLDAMQEDSIVLARVHSELPEDHNKHQLECLTSDAMVTDCSAGDVWLEWIRTSFLILKGLDDDSHGVSSSTVSCTSFITGCVHCRKKWSRWRRLIQKSWRSVTAPFMIWRRR